MEILHIPALRNPRMIVAFGGWNDAGDAATSVINHLLEGGTAQLIATVEPEDFYDFQVTRPTVAVVQGVGKEMAREITWPTLRVFGLKMPKADFDLVLAVGPEPSMRWKTFANDLLDLVEDLDVELLVSLGSLLADIPHTRPISVTGSGANTEMATRLGVGVSNYQGPTGILGILQDTAQRRGIDALSLWAAIPHYAAAPPSPKATLALLNALEDFLVISLPLGDIPDAARSWELAVDEIASEDSDIAEYVRQLEASKDEVDLPEATGESIARDFERYLRRKESE